MRKTTSGFSLMEFIIAILVIDTFILGFLFVANPSFKSLADSRRQSSLQTISLLMRSENMENQSEQKYFYAANEIEGQKSIPPLPGLKELFATHNFRTPEGTNNICYFIAMGAGESEFSGEDNEFLVSVWGESTSSKQKGKKGILMKGTEKAVKVFEEKNDNFSKEDFACSGEFHLLKQVFTEFVSEKAEFLFVDGKGKIEKVGE